MLEEYVMKFAASVLAHVSICVSMIRMLKDAIVQIVVIALPNKPCDRFVFLVK